MDEGSKRRVKRESPLEEECDHQAENELEEERAACEYEGVRDRESEIRVGHKMLEVVQADERSLSSEVGPECVVLHAHGDV